MTHRDAPIIAIVRSSAVVGTAAAVFGKFERAARESTTRAIWVSLAEAWRRYDRSARLRWIGMVLVTAVMVHVGLLALRPLPGWHAFVVPAIAFAQGLLLIASSSTPRSNQ